MKDEKDGFDFSRLQMNKVGRDDAATEVLKPKLDNATKSRNTVLIAVVAVAVVSLLVVQFVRSGPIWKNPEDQQGKQFVPGEHNLDKGD
jgi:hypothetical protein